MAKQARYLYSEISMLIQAIRACNESGNTEWLGRHTERLERLVKDHLPSGSGFDSGSGLDLERSHADRLEFYTSFHHMNDSGYYDGWTEHRVVVTPSFCGIHLRVTGRNRNGIKEYVGDVFYNALHTEVIE